MFFEKKCFENENKAIEKYWGKYRLVLYQTRENFLPHHISEHREESSNTMPSGVFLTNLQVLTNVLKRCPVKCMIYLLNQN